LAAPADEEGRQIGKYMELAFGYGGRSLAAFLAEPQQPGDVLVGSMRQHRGDRESGHH
jgi:hypothetical protein